MCWFENYTNNFLLEDLIMLTKQQKVVNYMFCLYVQEIKVPVLPLGSVTYSCLLLFFFACKFEGVWLIGDSLNRGFTVLK